MTKLIFSRNYVYLLAVCCGLLMLSACTTSQQKEATLEERAMARWDSLLIGDVEAAYEYLSPGYRSSVSLLQYHRTLLLSKVKWTGASYVKGECEESTCNVKILIDFTIYGALPGVKSMNSKQSIEESWLLVKGTWYLVPKN